MVICTLCMWGGGYNGLRLRQGTAAVVWIKKKGCVLNSLLIIVVFNECSCCKLKSWALAGDVGLCVYLCVDSKF